MKYLPFIPVLPGNLGGRGVHFVDARRLHAFLCVGRDFSTWIQNRIEEFEFVEGEDFSPVSGKSHGGRPTTDYLLTIDMVKELAMVERTARGREARRYFIDCERQLQQVQQTGALTRPAVVIEMSRAQKQAINRQAWADVAGQAYANFHARREELLRVRSENYDPVLLPQDFRPSWAK